MDTEFITAYKYFNDVNFSFQQSTTSFELIKFAYFE